ncbi:MAG: Gx transporter family protein [Oscillospiraceae bacterium]|nr:Gx transporter family protein [Oscillospiraceae bacterium]
MGKRIARYALLVSLAMVLSWLESLIVFPGLLPGMKVGLTNLVVVFALYRMSPRDAAAVSLARVALVSLTFGNAYSFAYSLAGAALSLAVMAGLKRTGRFSILGVSIAGGVCHNLGQLGVAMAVLGTARLGWYLPWLMAGGVAAGTAVGAAGGIVVDRVRPLP